MRERRFQVVIWSHGFDRVDDFRCVGEPDTRDPRRVVWTDGNGAEHSRALRPDEKAAVYPAGRKVA